MAVASDQLPSKSQDARDPEKYNKAIKQLCLRYEQLKSKPTMHDVMRDVEELDDMLSTCHDAPLSMQCRWLTAIANHPCMVPDSSVNAEVQVNTLLQYLSSPRCWVRALACSLLRVFSAALNARGEHIATQVTIICKNLATTLDESIKMTDLSLCQAIACSSLCEVCVFWVKVVPHVSVPFVLLTLHNILHILKQQQNCHSQFTYQVAVDGLRRLLTTHCVWDSILTSCEQSETLVQLFHLLQQFVSDEHWNDLIVAKLLETLNNVNILKTVLEFPDKLHTLLVILLDLLMPVSPLEPPVYVVRWRALSVVWQIIHLMDPASVSDLTKLLQGGCCESTQVSHMHDTVIRTHKKYLVSRRISTSNISFPPKRQDVATVPQ